MKRLTLFCGVFFLPLLTLAQSSGQKEKTEFFKLDSIVVEAYRAGKNTPVSRSEMGFREIKQISPTSSLPMALSLMPSVVTSTEGGNGLGYSSMRVRGSDGSRINVTLNGIAMNDAESQEVFWVNIPSFSNYLQDIQLQRGVGTSSNGAGAFGASLNLRTLFSRPEPYGIAEFGIGSYKSFLSTAGAGTGLMKSGLSFDIRYSHNTGEGYIRNAKSNLNSLFATLGWLKGASSLRINYIYGDQKTGITWEGISRDQMNVNRRFNPAGLYYDDAGNVKYYDNETDNYKQHHFQGHFTHIFKNGLSWSTTLHFTKGDGYYENYKMDRKFSDYKLSNQIIDGLTYKKSDMILRQALDNIYTAAASNIQYSSDKIKTTGGISYSYYDGDHFGNIIWSKYNVNVPENYKWYTNSGYKGDFAVFARVEAEVVEGLVAFTDLQYRNIKYNLRGVDKDFVSLNYDTNYNFLNPKLGSTYNINDANQVYASLSVGRKEPGRADIKESIKAGKAKDIKEERLLDWELGYRLNLSKIILAANIYLMEYKDQLVPTGKLSETGYVIKENVPESFRRGIEIAATYSPVPFLKLDANLTLSKNKIIGYTQWIDLYDNNTNWSPLPQRGKYYEQTNLSFSPSIVGMAMITLNPGWETSISLNGKFVGKQYYDNTSNDERSIPSYFLMGISGTKSLAIKGSSFVDLNLYVENLLNKKYFSNGWIYTAEFAEGSPVYVEEGLYPQAGINFTVKVAFRF